MNTATYVQLTSGGVYRFLSYYERPRVVPARRHIARPRLLQKFMSLAISGITEKFAVQRPRTVHTDATSFRAWESLAQYLYSTRSISISISYKLCFTGAMREKTMSWLPRNWLSVLRLPCPNPALVVTTTHGASDASSATSVLGPTAFAKFF